MTIQEKIIFCNDRSKKNKYFLAPQSLLKELEQEKINYKLINDMEIVIYERIFKLERG